MSSFNELELSTFCYRQFDDPKYTGSKITISKESFMEALNKEYTEQNKVLQDGYAPFCKHLFVKNFCDCRAGQIEITEETKPLIQTEYVARTMEELPVLSRFVLSSQVGQLVQKATFLDIILYSREQCEKEENKKYDPKIKWFVVSVKAQNVNFETPMNPITIMRNALGISEGGSGVQLNREKYMESVKYWKNHVIVRNDD
ncbi:hypothetical protein M0812_14526 [Anaeramoeba flamelloides]|uniref:Uncharacterized protein n=1 Tax=Anaeramoeba flamelloides TaxID=1746091 RepID=A0AAV7ZK83_9EUKA|nr:hypothetical protein M0812_14526 [Anaeramoeba flamelloides]